MRLFIAIELPEEMRAALHRTAMELKRRAKRASVAGKENYHLTLAFLGEVPAKRLREVREAMDAVAEEPFAMETGELGNFCSRGEALYWASVRECGNFGALCRIHDVLVTEFSARGLPVDEKPFKPHITLARRVQTEEKFDREAFANGLSHLRADVAQICLMKSERIDGGMVYTKLYAKKLGKP